MSKEKLIPELRFPEFKNEGEWDLKEFSKFIKLDRGSSPRPIQEYLTQDKSGVNWIKIGDTKNAINSVIYQVEEKITSKGAEKSRRVEKGELILANSMSFGKTYELAIEGCIYDGWFVLRKYENHFSKPFLLQLLNSDFMQNQYKRLSAGGIVQNISSDIVYNSKLFHVLLPEQKKIASCLSSLDELIAAHSQKLDLLKNHKKGLMQNLFPQEGETMPKYRFKEFENNGEWVEKTIDTIKSILTDYVANGSFQSLRENLNVVDSVDYAFYVRLTDLRAGLGHSNQKYVDESTYKFLNKSALFGGELLMANIGANVGEVWQMPSVNKPATLAPNMIMIKFKKDIDSEFVYQYLTSNIGVANISSVISGSGHPKISKTDLRQVKATLPPRIEEQQKIASCLSSLDALITTQADKIEQLKWHKKGLMQGLFPKMSD